MRIFLRAMAGLLLAICLNSEALAQTYYISPAPVGEQFLTDAGAVCNGCLLYHYLTGTTTTAAVYQTSSGTAHAQPIVLDSAGRATIYLDTAITYKFVLQTAAGVTIRTTDPVTLVAPSSFTITDNYIPRGTGAANGLEDSSITDTGTTVTIDPTGAISILGATTINGGATVTNGTFTAAGTVTLGTLTVTSCTGCGGLGTTSYIPFVDDALVISGAATMQLSLTTNTMTIDLPSAANSSINAWFRVPPDAAVTNSIVLVLNYTLSAAPGATNNKVKLITQSTVNNTAAAATAGDTITLANAVTPASYTATANIVAGSTYAVGDLVVMNIRRDVTVANDTDEGFRIITIGWTYTRQ